MATVDLDIASRRYAVACRDGEEDNLRAAAAMVDEKVRAASRALGNLSESRQFLFASLMLADALQDKGKGSAPARQEPLINQAVAEMLERLAERMEMLADRLESGIISP